jgi:hypothetical protein
MPVDWKSKESYQRLLAAMVAASGASKDMKVFSIPSKLDTFHFPQSYSFSFLHSCLISRDISILECSPSLCLNNVSLAGAFLSLFSSSSHTLNP